VTSNDKEPTMETTRIPNDQLEKKFDDFTKRFLGRESTTSSDVEILAPNWGAQFETEGARLRGITYDSKDRAIEFELDSGEHRINHPREVWTVEEPDGFIKAIEVVRDDDAREIVQVKRHGLRPSS
jgi:hypothetical protein